ncbi:unnamed protein product [Orchesella dallaii]|uniref:Protein msta n=1 Tax=Orchesella dallaii TaxID=48710 RepID=A0ABP1QXY5_9HEXA
MEDSAKLLLSTISIMDSPTCQPPARDKISEESYVIDEILSKVYIHPPKNPSVCEEVRERVSEKNEMNIQTNPIALKHDLEMGRCLVAARDIEPGEIFLNDWPLITAPNAGQNSTTCLGCGLIQQTLQPCARCGWPVCNDQCSNIPQHADFECKIFAKENIKPDLPSPYSYIASAEYIKILRCLLLKDESSPEKMMKWKLILSLEAHMDIRRHIPRVQLMSGLVKKFVKSICKLNQFDEETVDFALGVVDVNAFRHSFAPAPLKPMQTDLQEDSPAMNATFVYPTASMAAHGCVRNTDWKTLSGGQLEMRASHKILKGQVICHAYVDLMLGTPERRRLLHKLFYFECSCPRCADKTELNTYFSALKCTECKTGYLLAENPLQHKSQWICSQPGCSGIKSYQYERELVQQILAEEKAVCDQIELCSNLTTIRSLMKVLKKHRDVTVHPNHYRVVNIEHILVRHLLKVPKPPVEIKLEMKRLIKKYMRLSAVFHPTCDE